ncbi:NAD-dependent protein deacetylase sirtuin-2 [Boothiomyces macroporosus]|uniref:NAD-dependent protein deacetylase n=1 Tax=Boothiomyces macroporosus TaxID=261099 RepID=A0AAD5ULB6_9FUNG|nr:NAD-dependent protein deacetylase sirtuin-2 [Boothiomyces macroporosus]
MSGRKPPTERPFKTPLDEKMEDDSLNIIKDSSLAAFAEYIKKNNCKNIIVMTGAGISTSADFRTPGTGLYDNLQKYNLPFPEAIFDIRYFKAKPEPFFELSRELFPGTFQPTPCHKFIKALADKGMLLRNYTQNIDMLERIAGIPGDLIVEAHGSFHQATCVGRSVPPIDQPLKETDEAKDEQETEKASDLDDDSSEDDPEAIAEYERLARYTAIPGCGKRYTIEEFKKQVFQRKNPTCECEGLIKPDIVFFGEQLPNNFYNLQATDFDRCDALIVMGTSLKVAPFCELINFVGRQVPRLLINMEQCGDRRMQSQGFDFIGDVQKYRRDAFYQGTCDEGCRRLAKELGFDEFDDVDRLIKFADQLTIQSEATVETKDTVREGENSVAFDTTLKVADALDDVDKLTDGLDAVKL